MREPYFISGFVNYLLGLTILFWFSTHLLIIQFPFPLAMIIWLQNTNNHRGTVLQTQIKTLFLSLQTWDILSKGFMYRSMYLTLYIAFHITFPPFFSLSFGLCFSAVSGTLTSELIPFWNWGTSVMMILKRILLTLHCLFKVNPQMSSSLDILICTYTWMWSFLYKIHIYTQAIILYMHYIYYIYLKYIYVCVYIYLFFTDRFPPWCVKDLFTVRLESMYCLSIWTMLQTSPWWNIHSIGMLAAFCKYIERLCTTFLQSYKSFL